jgi:shikimate dehydrogenase
MPRRIRQAWGMPRLAVLGQPISHSRSPAMHSAALEELGLAPDWAYEAIEVAPEDFESRVRAMAGEGFAGANVTIPHKLAALAVADEASDAAREIGAANTLTFSGDRIAAENTDGTGILDAVAPLYSLRAQRRQEGGEWLEGKGALVLGAGGSARAAIWALKGAGADVAIWNRTVEKAADLANELGGHSVSLIDGENLPLQDIDLVLNATSVGLGADPDRDPSELKALRIDADSLSDRHVVVDLVYGAAETELVAAASSRGASVVDGLEVLVRQGAASLHLWTGLEPPVETMRRAARSAEWQAKTAPDT